jgi:hypothetical protein
VKLPAAFSASSLVTTWIRGKIKAKTRPRNRSQSAWVSAGPEISLALTWSSMWKTTGRWSSPVRHLTVRHFDGQQHHVHQHMFAV